MRINHNIPAMTALRNLSNTGEMTTKNLERLSSGLKINRASDGPASLVVSERMRSQISGLGQAIANSETSISMVQTAEGALSEVSGILVNLRQLALHAANDGANDAQMLEADQSEVENLLNSLNRIASQTQFGTKTLLDGSNGANGAAVGDNLYFVKATPDTVASPPEGYAIDITQIATQTQAKGNVALNALNAKNGVTIVLSEGGKNAILNTDVGDIKATIEKLVKTYEDNPDSTRQNEANAAIQDVISNSLQSVVNEAGLEVDVSVDPMGMLTVRHREFGSKHNLSVSSSVAGVLSKSANVSDEGILGKDVAGTIGGEIGLGDGQILQGGKGTPIEGLSIKFTKTLEDRLEDVVDPKTGAVTARQLVSQTNKSLVGGPVDGYVHVTQHSLSYQVGPNKGQQVKISLGNVRANRLSQGIENESDFNSLADVDVRSSKGAQDAIKMIDHAVQEVSGTRAELGSFQRNSLESNLNSLKIASENLTNAESIIRDADMAAEMSDFTKNQIMMSSGTAMAAQANQMPKSVLQLLNGGGG